RPTTTRWPEASSRSSACRSSWCGSAAAAAASSSTSPATPTSTPSTAAWAAPSFERAPLADRPVGFPGEPGLGGSGVQVGQERFDVLGPLRGLVVEQECVLPHVHH